MKIQKVGGIYIHAWCISSTPSLLAPLRAGGDLAALVGARHLMTSHILLLSLPLPSVYQVPAWTPLGGWLHSARTAHT